MPSSVPNSARRNITTASPSPSISLAGLKANQDIFDKHAYIQRYTTALQSRLDREYACEKLCLDRCHRALGKFHPKPLDTEQDESELKKQREKIEKQIPELEGKLRGIREEDGLIQSTMEELNDGMEGDKTYTEWVLMPSLVWNLARLG